MKAEQGLHYQAAEGTRLPNWKPLYFSPVYILFITVLHILQIVGIQLLVKQRGQDEDKINLVQHNVTITNPSSIFIIREDDTAAFMAWTYLPVAISTVIATLWEALDVSARRLEPFHQLSSSKGGNVDNAMCLDYMAIFSFFVPFSAMKKGHHPVAVASTIFLVASIVIPTLAGGIFSLEWGSLTFAQGRTEGPKLATVTINSGLAIATQAIHGFVVLMGVAITIMLLLRRTGIYHDPKGIGGLAPLISDLHRTDLQTLEIFHQLPSFAKSEVVSAALSHITFHLVHVPAKNPDGTSFPTYQLATNTQPGYDLQLSLQDRGFTPNRREVMGFWLTKRAVWFAEIFLWLGIASITTAVYQVARVLSSTESANRAQPMITKMVLTLCMSVGGLMWTNIQRQVQVFEPWRQLSRNRPRALYAALRRSDRVSLGLVGSFIFSIFTGALVMAWSSFIVFMVQAATIFVPPLMELAYTAGYAGNHDIAVLSGQTGVGLLLAAISIHVAIFCNLLFLLLSGRTRPFLPRAPSTIASQIIYLCRSDRLLEKFTNTSMDSNQDLAKTLRKANAQCLFGWFQGNRGLWYVGVEECQMGQWYKFDFWNAGGFNPCT